MLKPWVRIALLLFCVGWGANHFVALLLVYKQTLALDAAAPAALLGMYALGLVPGLLLSGPLSDRYGRRALVFPATAVTLLASALLGAAGGSFHGAPPRTAPLWRRGWRRHESGRGLAARSFSRRCPWRRARDVRRWRSPPGSASAPC